MAAPVKPTPPSPHASRSDAAAFPGLADATIDYALVDGPDYIELAADYVEARAAEAMAAAAVVGGNARYTDAAALLASVETARGNGVIWEAGVYRYIEVASGGDVTTTGGVELDVIASSTGIFNVVAFGATGDGTTDDATTITAALSGGNKTVVFPAGQFLIKSYLRVYADTVIEMHPDCVILNDNLTYEYAFVNGDLGNLTYATGYAGDGNITIRGGTIDSAAMVARTALSQCIAIGHAENVLIENVTFKNNYDSHFVEINASKNVTIRNCVFDTLTPIVSGSRECIDIDYSYAGGFPPFGSYDNTVCVDVTVVGNYFIDGDVAVGSHATPAGTEAWHIGIRIIDNYIENMTSKGVDFRNWRNSNVSGNYILSSGVTGIDVVDTTKSVAIKNHIIDSGEAAIRIKTTSDYIELNSNFVGGANQNNTANSAIKMVGDNCISSLNVVDHGGYATQYTYAIEVTGDDCVLTDNTLTSGATGITEIDTVIVKVDGAFLARVVDDGFMSIPFIAKHNQGIISVATDNTSASSIRGLFWAKCTSGSLAMTEVAAITAANTTLTTGVLNGTTGVNGEMTLSAAADLIYLENRGGGDRSVAITIIGEA